MAISKAQTRANKKWKSKNKDRSKYYAYRSAFNNFINPKTEIQRNVILLQDDYLNDLKAGYEALQKRIKEIEKNS